MLILLQEPNTIWGNTPEKGINVMEKLTPGQVNQIECHSQGKALLAVRHKGKDENSPEREVDGQ